MAQTYTAKQVADLAGMTKDGILKARRRGKFPHTKKIVFPDGRWEYRFSWTDVREFLLFERNIELEDIE